MKKLASDVRRGDHVLIGGKQHVAIAPAANTYGGTTVCSVPEEDRNAEETYTDFGNDDDVELW